VVLEMCKSSQVVTWCLGRLTFRLKNRVFESSTGYKKYGRFVYRQTHKSGAAAAKGSRVNRTDVFSDIRQRFESSTDYKYIAG
jgi:hypothetical protein